jgi:chromosomal replication initiation ATPase DnaA
MGGKMRGVSPSKQEAFVRQRNGNDLASVSLREELRLAKETITKLEFRIGDLRAHQRELIEQITALNGQIPESFRSMYLIAEEVCKKHNKTIEALRGPSRAYDLTIPRGEFSKRAREELGIAYSAIGRFLGNRDHASIFYVIKRFEGVSPAEARYHRVVSA